MILLLLEALAALALFVLAVWWTMFSGRPKGELPPELQETEAPRTAADHRDPPGSD